MALYRARASISTQTARRIAGEWHGGQWSALYSLCSTGNVDPRRLLWEIDHDLNSISAKGAGTPKERFRLRVLRAWVQNVADSAGENKGE